MTPIRRENHPQCHRPVASPAFVSRALPGLSGTITFTEIWFLFTRPDPPMGWGPGLRPPSLVAGGSLLRNYPRASLLLWLHPGRRDPFPRPAAHMPGAGLAQGTRSGREGVHVALAVALTYPDAISTTVVLTAAGHSLPRMHRNSLRCAGCRAQFTEHVWGGPLCLSTLGDTTDLLHPVLAERDIQRGVWAPRQTGCAAADLITP